MELLLLLLFFIRVVCILGQWIIPFRTGKEKPKTEQIFVESLVLNIVCHVDNSCALIEWDHTTIHILYVHHRRQRSIGLAIVLVCIYFRHITIELIHLFIATHIHWICLFVVARLCVWSLRLPSKDIIVNDKRTQCLNWT